MNRIYRFHCHLFDCLLSVQSDDLMARYGDEIRSVFRDQLSDAWKDGLSAILGVWFDVIAETIALVTPRCLAHLRLVFAATALASVLTIGSALGFCTLGATPVVHACPQEQPGAQPSAQSGTSGSLVQLPDGRHMFLECSGDANAVPTVILANGRGLGTADSWAQVQRKVIPSIRVCSYDAMGAGRSDRVQGPPQFHPIDQVISEMHSLFLTAQLKQPFVLVGASAGGILVRRYQQQYPHEIAGLVFVDSAHEEMEWRDAAISPQTDPNWNNPVFLRENGFLPNHQKLTWHADIPLIDLERSEKAPLSAFPGLIQQQVDAMNAAWHDFQVDLAGRSKFGQLRIVPGSGHRMHEQRPDAIADAIQDVIRQARSKAY
ncbi:alpha/beta fold hydrolase [Paracidobacterium acidisoli]|uniref:Alpha/beta fold hydrolase n=1 Tax=Paracidobacterium acidisoli TaxID=2303751 RepID=A0A372IUH6_9BACT|nr:alpha/beta fold hydrolase [Paracidobacterium acidisoli]MBT9330034.1 alpha/beta hydrolase [Paracidobacterium acidisoli]